MPYKCDGFERGINQSSVAFKSFKRVMDKRNQIVHGNVDPERDAVETVYFEGRRPLFDRGGDQFVRFWEALERERDPRGVLADYEDTFAFLLDLTGCLKPEMKIGIWDVLECSYPGFDSKRGMTGRLFGDSIIGGYMHGLKYDDELRVQWP